MALSQEFKAYVLELLDPVQPFTFRPMFGGAGFFVDGKMFALISRSDALYLKTDEQNRGEFQDMESEPHYGLKPYWLAPADLLEDQDRLCELARGSIAVARRSPDKPKKKKARAKKKPA
jgi:DNA transformation protein